MKKLCLVALVGVFVSIGFAESLDERKAQLERQIQELEEQNAKEAQIKELEEKLNKLQQTTAKQSQQTNKSTQNLQTQQAQRLQTPQIQPDSKIERDGAFLAIGLNMTEINTLASNSLFLDGLKIPSAIFFGGRLGYQIFSDITPALGMRVYLDGYTGKAKNENNSEIKASYYLVSGNFDLLLEANLPNTNFYFGIFVGLGYGIYSYKETNVYFNKSLLAKGLVGNMGAALTFGGKHRLEFSYKIPPVTEHDGEFSYKSSSLVGITYQRTF
ncbi:hypothetical protein CQA49_02530 [Helicobacter sp. MIT 00-7814]|uniref:outer membrane beta-barrel protein n=1 Tax=unclassified Helicobacter TaxID=2593540 RepID=UPI000E1E8783|nr:MULTISPECIES: outer membrane beta-barrel protein [unclassified Helicobacter]RDU55263.1 hypothetical protein CQA37_04220 [Helicobacter sp. MIT 99-10781]RDU56101.1 hypothetical protein CQA49_02530 [Helicobacter sp. MIT 00-7814]